MGTSAPGSQADSNGHVACYKTKASEIGLGWATKKVYKNGKTNHMYGCFYAEKIKKDNMHSYVLDESATVNIGKANPRYASPSCYMYVLAVPAYGRERHTLSSQTYLHSDFYSCTRVYPSEAFTIPACLMIDPTASNRMVTRFMQKGEVLCVNRHIVEGGTNYHACKVAYNGTDYYKELSLPSHWSWGDAFQGDNDNIQPFSQGMPRIYHIR